MSLFLFAACRPQAKMLSPQFVHNRAGVSPQERMRSPKLTHTGRTSPWTGIASGSSMNVTAHVEGFRYENKNGNSRLARGKHVHG